MTKRSGDEFGTPPEFFQMLNKRFHFRLDPCARPDNDLGLPHYFTKEDDGLVQDWSGLGSVFMNPPYSTGRIGLWVEKAHHEAEVGVLVVGLVRHDTSTKWWNKFIKNHTWVWGVPFRLKFVGGDGAYNFPSAVVVWHGLPSERIV